MNKYGSLLCGALLGLTLTASAFAATNADAIKAQYPVYSAPSLNGYTSLSTGVQEYLNTAKQNYIASLGDLKTKLTKLHSNDPVIVAQIEKLTKAINKKASAQTIAEKSDFNPFELQIIDAYMMLDGIEKAANNTLTLLQRLSVLADQALDGKWSDADRARINVEYQAYLEAMQHIQTVYTYNGQKKVSGGSITLTFGAQPDELSTLTVDLPGFDVAALGLKGSNVSTVMDAGRAYDTVKEAIEKINVILGKVKRVNDAEAMLIMVPSMINQSFNILDSMLTLAVKAANGIYSDDPDREMFNYAFEDWKSQLSISQTYLSLQGPKMIGTGTMHIQIGEVNSPETTLNIPLPAADIKQSALDKADLKTQASAVKSTDVIYNLMHDFVYPAKN